EKVLSQTHDTAAFGMILPGSLSRLAATAAAQDRFGRPGFVLRLAPTTSRNSAYSSTDLGSLASRESGRNECDSFMAQLGAHLLVDLVSSTAEVDTATRHNRFENRKRFLRSAF